MVVVAQRLKDKRLTGALLIVPLLLLAFLLTLEQDDGIVSAFVASTLKHTGRTPTPALIVTRDPSTVPAIDWDVFEREERYAFDAATIIPPLSLSRQIDPKFLPPATAPNPLLSNRADTSMWLDTTSGTTVSKIEIAPDDPDAWKGSLLMTAGLLIGHHEIPALLLLLSTAAHGEFGTAVRLTSRCLWHSVTVCQVLSTAGFQSITELLKDVGVIEQPQPKNNEGKENWMMSWAKRTWKDAVQQERKWADSIRQSLFEAPEEPNETMTMIFQAKEPVVVATPTFAATLKREDGVVLHLPVVSTDPLSVSNINKEEKESGDEVLLQLPTMVVLDASSLAATNSNNNKQRVRDLMRQRREELQQNVDAAVDAPKLVVKAVVAPKAVVVDMEAAARQQMTNGGTAADGRQRVRDLMRQKRVGATSGNSVSALADHKAAVATPSLVLAEKEMMATTAATTSLHPGDRTAADSRQRVRDLMRMQRERQQGYAAPATTSTGMFSATTTTTTPSTSTPSLFTSPYTTTTAAANLLSATQRAAHSRQRVRDLLRQKQAREVDSRGTEGIMATVVTAPMIQERDVPVPAPQPKDEATEAAAPATSSFTSMEEQFRKQRAINALVRNKIRGMRMQKRMIDNGSLKVKHEDEPAQYKMSVSGRTPLTVTEKKTLAQARAALATARQMQTQLAASAKSSIEPEMSPRRSWRSKICQLLMSASPHGWVATK
jgi:hypothetical protein